MVVILQRILQLILVGFLVFICFQPEAVPEPMQPFSKGFSRAVMGPEVSWKSFRHVWMDRGNLLVSIFPQLKKYAVSAPPEDLTADTILNLMEVTFIFEPLKKWQTIQDSLWDTPPATASPTQK